MATTYNTAFGSLPGYNEMLGTTNTTGGGQQQVYGQRTQQQRQTQQPAQTFAQMQRQGVARPAPPQAPQAQPFAQYGGSQQAQQMRQRLQSQLETFGQTPSRFDTQAFQQIRGAQAANIRSEFEEQQRQLNEDLARRGLSASNIAASGLGRLGGAQARALADIDAQLLQRAAETQAADRAQLLAEGRGLAELASAQDLAQFEANRVAQAATFENQLRAAQFGQQQFEQMGQEAFQGAQAEEAAQQAARAFDLQATGQAATLSMDLQRLLGQQEVERAQLTGQLGGAQTLAAQQQAEQRRQFDIQQALQAQLGLGGLGIQQQEVNIRAQQLQQEGALQGRQLSITEAQNLAQNQLEQQRITNQANQFGLQLNEQQAQRMQQAGFTAQELALEARKVENQVDQFGRQLSAQERQNQALNALEARKLNEDVNFRSQQLGLNRDELEARKAQIQGDLMLRGIEIDDQRAYREAEIEARTQQIQNEFLRSGQQIDVDKARIQAQRDISDADNKAQMARLETQLITQVQEADLERRLRGALGMAETTGFVFDTRTGQMVRQDGQPVMTVQGRSALAQQRLAENQFLMQLVSALGNVDLGKSIRDFVADRDALGGRGGGGGYDPRQGGGEGGRESGDTGQTDSIKGRRPIASEFNPAFMDNLAFTLDQPTARVAGATAPSSTLQALAAALGISPSALQATLTTRPTTTQSALSSVLGALSPSATPAPSTRSTTTPDQLWASIVNSPSGRAGDVLTPQQLNFAIQQSPSLQAYQQRLNAIPANQRSRYIPVSQLPVEFVRGQAVPEGAQPGTVYANYGKDRNATMFMGYDGTGFIPLTRANDGTYRTSTGERWA